jgi:hypothetical protein
MGGEDKTIDMANNPDIDTGTFVGSHGTAKQWLKRIQSMNFSNGAFTCASVLCEHPNCIILSDDPKSIKLDLSRFELMFVAIKKYLDLSEDELEQAQIKIEELLKDLIDKSILVDLIKFGKLLSENTNLLSVKIVQKIFRTIFERLSQMEEIEEISNQIALKAAGIDDWE